MVLKLSTTTPLLLLYIVVVRYFMDRRLKKLLNAHSKYEGVIGNVEAEISDKVEFNFSIFWQPSDGFVMLAFDRYNAPLSRLLQIIKIKGKLTEEDYMDETI